MGWGERRRHGISWPSFLSAILLAGKKEKKKKKKKKKKNGRKWRKWRKWMKWEKRGKWPRTRFRWEERN